jgi:hypothetical protein
MTPPFSTDAVCDDRLAFLQVDLKSKVKVGGWSKDLQFQCITFHSSKILSLQIAFGITSIL